MPNAAFNVGGDVSGMDYAAADRAAAARRAAEEAARRQAEANRNQAYGIVNQQIAQSGALAGQNQAGRNEALGLARAGAANAAAGHGQALDMARRAASVNSTDPDMASIQGILMSLARTQAPGVPEGGAANRRTAGFAQATDRAAEQAGARALQFADRGVGGVNAGAIGQSFAARNLGQQQQDVQRARQGVESQYSEDVARENALRLQQQNQNFQQQLSGASAAFNVANQRGSRDDAAQARLIGLLNQGSTPDEMRLQELLRQPAQSADTSAQNRLLDMLLNEQFSADNQPVDAYGRPKAPIATVNRQSSMRGF